MTANDLKPQWRTFAEKMALGLSATEAYLQSGFQPSSRENAQRSGSRLSRRPAIAAYIQDIREQALTLAAAETALPLAAKLAFLARVVATSAATLRGSEDIGQVYRQYSDGSIAIHLPCKLSAIRLHTKLSESRPLPSSAKAEVPEENKNHYQSTTRPPKITPTPIVQPPQTGIPSPERPKSLLIQKPVHRDNQPPLAPRRLRPGASLPVKRRPDGFAHPFPIGSGPDSTKKSRNRAPLAPC